MLAGTRSLDTHLLRLHSPGLWSAAAPRARRASPRCPCVLPLSAPTEHASKPRSVLRRATLSRAAFLVPARWGFAAAAAAMARKVDTSFMKMVSADEEWRREVAEGGANFLCSARCARFSLARKPHHQGTRTRTPLCRRHTIPHPDTATVLTAAARGITCSRSRRCVHRAMGRVRYDRRPLLQLLFRPR